MIGTDGGPLEEPSDVERLRIAPAERFDVMVRFDGARGSTLTRSTEHLERGFDLPAAPLEVLHIEVAGAVTAALPSAQTSCRAPAP